MPRMMLRVGLVLAMVGASLTVYAGAAHAAAGQVYVDGSRLVYVAQDGTASDVIVKLVGSQFTIDDIVGMNVGRGCTHPTPLDTTYSTCTAFGVASANISTGDLDDRVNYWPAMHALIHGGKGDDTLWGGGGDDSLWGDAGNDTLYGWNGNDILYGGAGTDRMYGQNGTQDRVSYDESPVAVFVDFDGVSDDGAPGENDTIGLDVENAHGSNFNDWLIGNDGVNELRGLHGNDVIVGLGGDDLLIGDGFWDGVYGADYFSGGAGADTVSYWDHTTAVSADLDGASGDDGSTSEGDTIASDVENLTGSRFNDWLVGNSGPNSISGLTGDDWAFGLDGDDSLSGDDGNDRLYGGNGNDIVGGHAGDDWLYGEAGADNLYGDVGNDHCDVGAGGSAAYSCES